MKAIEYDHIPLKVWFSQGMTSRNIPDVVSIEISGNMMKITTGNKSEMILNFDNVNLIEEIETKEPAKPEESTDADDEEPHEPEDEEVEYCCICNEPITKIRKNHQNAKYPTCRSKSCRSKAQRFYQDDWRNGRVKTNITPERQAGIDRMKKEIDTPEKLATFGPWRERLPIIAKKYGIRQKDAKKHNDELLVGMTCKEKMNMVTSPHKEKQPQQKNLASKLPDRKPVPVKVFKITDMEAFEAGGHGTYEGLEFEREETQYVKEPRISFNPGLREEAVLYENDGTETP